MSKHSTLGNGEWLLKGNSLWSADGTVEFKMQGDGKIAVYKKDKGCIYQNTSSQRYDIKGVIMQDDGNLVLYDNSGNATWASNTNGQGNSTTTLVVQNDGNVCVFNGQPPFWATNTA